MGKRIFTLIVVCIVLTSAACGSKSENTTGKASKSTEVSPTNHATVTRTAIEYDIPDRHIDEKNPTEITGEDELANTTDKNINYEEIYNNFLSGQIDAVDKEGCISGIKGQILNIDYYQKSDPPQKYAIYDMNGDAIPELILRTRVGLDIFWIYNNELTLWHSDAAYTKPLNNMALLYERPGGGPSHTYYMYIVLGYQGEELYRIDFAEFYNWDVNGIDYGEKYFIDNTEVTKAIYDSLSERFLTIGDDKIEWKTFSFPQ